MTKEDPRTDTKNPPPIGLEVIDRLESRGYGIRLTSVADLLSEKQTSISVYEAREKLLRSTDSIIANFDTGVEYFRSEGKYHTKRIVILGTVFRSKGSRVGGVNPDLFVYPVDSGSGNMGWMILRSDEKLKETDFVLMVSQKP